MQANRSLFVPGDPTDAVPRADLVREWLVANGLGGYAMGTVAGVPTRSYHGLLVAALAPPVGRTVLVGGLLEVARVAGGTFVELHALERADATLDGRADARPVSVELEGMRPVFRYDLGGVVLEKRIWMAYGSNTTYVRYSIVASDQAVGLDLRPLTTFRDHHAMATRDDCSPGGPLRILAPGASVRPLGDWLTGLRHREETARGQADRSDAYLPVAIRATVTEGRPFTLILTAELDEPLDAEAALAIAESRDAELLRLAAAEDASPFVCQLVLAADQFIVARDIPRADGAVEHGRSVIAGYPWFNDWGRDTMIALPGLCLSTGRHDEAATILRSFARFVRDGLLPNDFPDNANVTPGYHTIDASLWYAIAIRAHREATGSPDLLDELLPTLRTILEAHIAGTRFGIGMDPADGLLRGGAEGYQLTWMDARVDGWVVTPRQGKPVEIQALWVTALRVVGERLVELGDAGGGGTRYLALATQAQASFLARFWAADRGYLMDVVDGPDGDDATFRPNQLLALSLPHPLVEGAAARRILAGVRDELAVPLGLRSLAPSDPAYRPHFQGDRHYRDSGYHQGTVWTWLVGAYAEATARVTGDPATGLDILRPFEAHLRDGGLGSISEILEPEPPFEPRGCPFQAWGVAEVLRVWRSLGGE